MRKQYVDAALETERLEKEAKKKAQKENENQMTNQNFVFGNIQATRSRRGVQTQNDTMINTAECLADITTRFANFTQEVQFKPIEKYSATKGNVIGTRMDETKFYQMIAWLCEQKKAKVTYGKKDKLSVTYNHEGSNIEVKVVFYSEQCDNGLKMAEFMKLSGCICIFHTFVTDIINEFDSMNCN